MEDNEGLMEQYPSEAIITSKSISIPLNGEPSTITFQLDLGNGVYQNYTDILKDYPEEFLLECIGKNVPLTLEPVYWGDGTFKEYKINQLHYEEVELHGIGQDD